MKVCFVAAPLTARSGVYRSARELVEAGRHHGQEWSLILGVAESAAGERPADDPEWVDEFTIEPRGLRGVRRLAGHLRSETKTRTADLVISLIPQTDMALACTRLPWVAYTRGLPWPASGETGDLKRMLWKTLERGALTRAESVWATTSILKDQLGVASTDIVPAGIAPVPRSWDGAGERSTIAWAARFDPDKRPGLFADALRSSALTGVMYGTGRLKDHITSITPPNVSVAGWVSPHAIWDCALAYAGTSSREAFGRSAVEAAMSGIPVVLSRHFGCAELIVQDAAFAEHFVLDTDDPGRWRQAFEMLHADEGLRRAYSAHLVETSSSLTIDASARAVARHADTALRRRQSRR